MLELPLCHVMWFMEFAVLVVRPWCSKYWGSQCAVRYNHVGVLTVHLQSLCKSWLLSMHVKLGTVWSDMS